MVKAVVTGTGELRSITIAPDVVDPDDVEMLEDLVVAAVVEATALAQELQPSAWAASPAGSTSAASVGLLG